MKYKNLLLILFGFIPLMLGFLINWLIMNFQTTIIPFNIIGYIFLIFWFFLGFISYKFQKNIAFSLSLIHLPIFLALILNLYQEIILGEYFSNTLGICTQFFFLPTLNISVSFLTNYLWQSYIVGFIFMCFSYYAGYLFKKRQN